MPHHHSLVHYFLYWAALVGGIAVDITLAMLQRRDQKRSMARVVAFLIAGLPIVPYMVAVALTSEIWWRVHMWAGLPVIAGLAGVLLSYLIIPPAGYDVS